MPSAMVGNNAVQSAIPDLGSGSQSETMKQVLAVVDKKVRNMEKKKVYLYFIIIIHIWHTFLSLIREKHGVIRLFLNNRGKKYK